MLKKPKVVFKREPSLKVAILDFDKVPTIGQAFADEVFRVFKESHPEIEIQSINTNPAVDFMIKRAIKTKR